MTSIPAARPLVHQMVPPLMEDRLRGEESELGDLRLNHSAALVADVLAKGARCTAGRQPDLATSAKQLRTKADR